MPPLATDLSRERMEFLLQAHWPTNLGDVDDWLINAPRHRPADTSDGGMITPIRFNTHEGHLSSFYWFAHYTDPAQLVEAHDDLGSLISTLLGTPGVQNRAGDHSGYWLTQQFAIETYAHDISEREDGRQLIPTLQVNVADATMAATKEALARRSV